MAQDDAIVRLARRIGATRQSERLEANADEVARLRALGACELHRVCADFVASVNGNSPEAVLDLAPPAYAAESFRAHGVNLFQIGSQGREIQIVFEAPATLVSTEKFLAPYVLEGEIRAYNQKMLERFEIRSRMLFFCVQENLTGWRVFDWRTRHTGPVDRDLLASMMSPLF